MVLVFERKKCTQVRSLISKNEFFNVSFLQLHICPSFHFTSFTVYPWMHFNFLEAWFVEGIKDSNL